MEEQKQIRCAIYTRKSTDEGLEKEFNTLEAQREAGENFVMSMKHQGWVILPERYDDGGFSGGNLKRPALKRLMADVEKGIVDMIVVYKIDRLTRSLLDFAQLVQTFEKNNCSFVSVTQHFNTCDSMGKLTLNKARAGVPVDLELGYQLSDTQRLVITCHEVYLPKPKRSISGPGGIECTYDFQGAKNAELGKMVSPKNVMFWAAILKNRRILYTQRQISLPAP